MGKIPKNIIVLIGIVICAALVMGVSPAETKKNTTEEQAKNPYENSRILVEAFVVEVELAELYKAGVGPIGQRPNLESMEKILNCLQDEDKAKVTAGAKIAVKNDNKGRTNSSIDRYIERETAQYGKNANEPVQKSKTFEVYGISTEFWANTYVRPDGSISVGFTFEQKKVDYDIKSDEPAGKITRQWDSHICLEAGKPSIAGAVQEGQTVVFLIIVADIENK